MTEVGIATESTVEGEGTPPLPTRAGRQMLSAAAGLSFLIRGYRRIISPWIPPACRYVPTCSQYLLDALDQHGARRGAWLGLKRILRCHPFGGHGFDPIPSHVKTARGRPRSMPQADEREF